MVAWRGAKVGGEPNRRGAGSHGALISAHASGLLYLSHPTFAAHVGTSRSCQKRNERPRDPKPQWEFPRLCRGGSKSLTYPVVDTAAPSTKLRIASRQAHEEGFD